MTKIVTVVMIQLLHEVFSCFRSLLFYCISSLRFWRLKLGVLQIQTAVKIGTERKKERKVHKNIIFIVFSLLLPTRNT